MSLLREIFGLSNRMERNSKRSSSDRITQRKAIRRLLVEQLEGRRVLAAPSPLALGSLNGTNGFRIDGAAHADFSGSSVSGVGDVNGDGFDDVIVGAWGANPSAAQLTAGLSYVVFGKSGGFTQPLVLSSLSGSNGFQINGINSFD